LPPSMVAISAHLHIDHWLFHGREPPSVTEASLSQATPVEQFAGYSKTAQQLYGQFRRHLKTHLFIGVGNHGAL